MSDKEDKSGTPRREERPRRSSGQGPRIDRSRNPHPRSDRRDGERKPYRREERSSDSERRYREDRPQQGDRPDRGGERRSYGDRPDRGSERRPYSDRPTRDGQLRFDDRPGRSDRNTRGPRDGRASERPRWNDEELTEEQRIAREHRMVRRHHDDPEIPEDVSEKELDPAARNELKTLTKENAEVVAKHLVMAVRLIDENPELAHQHVLSASRRAGRIAIVRETLGITAYAIGDFALALRELRTYRRISGSNEQIALMVDSERGIGRPDKALELGRSVDRSTLSEATQVALAIAMSGARLDLNQVDLALAELEIAQLDPTKAFSYSPSLFRAYAEVLEELGRHQEAAEWINCAEAAEKALIDAQIIASRDQDNQDMIVVEEDLPNETSSPVLSEPESIVGGEFTPAEERAILAEGIRADDLLEDDVRAILMETAHLDSTGDNA